MDIQKQIEELQDKIINLGEIVAAQKTTTKFPKWCLLKIGLSTIQGYVYDHEYYENLLEQPVKKDESN